LIPTCWRAPKIDQMLNKGTEVINAIIPFLNSKRVAARRGSGLECRKLPWVGAASIKLPVPIGINGNAYTVGDLIASGNTGYSTIGFAIVGGSTWEVYGATPVGGNTVKASGAVPATAVTVQYTWTLIGPPAGDVDSGGTLTNGASSPTTLGSNPASYYTTSTYNGRSGSRGRTYQLRVDFFNTAALASRRSVRACG